MSESKHKDTGPTNSGIQIGKIQTPRLRLLANGYVPGVTGAVVVLLIAGAFVLWQIGRRTAGDNKICDQQIIHAANKQFDKGNIEGLATVARQIENLHGYQNDKNCLYIVTKSQIWTDDIVGAQKSMAKLENLSGKLDSSLDHKRASVSTLKTALQSTNQADENATGKIESDYR